MDVFFHWKKSLYSNVQDKGCVRLFNDDENFQVGLDLIYTLALVPPEDVGYAWTEIVLEYFEQHFDEVTEVDNYLFYVESTYIGQKNRLGVRKNPRFPVTMWNIYTRIINQEPTTNNSVESWNARFNSSHRTNHNVLRIIRGFKAEDALARTKFQEEVVGKSTIHNPGRKNRISARYENLRLALTKYKKANIKEFMYGMRGDV